jgi:hypothetical protein
MKLLVLAAAIASLALECQVESNFSRKKHSPPPPAVEDVEPEPDAAVWAPFKAVPPDGSVGDVATSTSSTATVTPTATAVIPGTDAPTPGAGTTPAGTPATPP